LCRTLAIGLDLPTLIGATCFGYAGQRVEITATAVVPDPERDPDRGQ
jgi:hypothetical protein